MTRFHPISKNFLFFAIPASLIFLAYGPTCQAATREVGPGQAYATISSAISASVAGDTINVHSGTYAENVSVSKSLTVQKNANDAPIISGSVSIGVGVSQVTLDGFTITGGKSDLVYARNSNRITIKNNNIYGGLESGIVIISGNSSDNTYANGTMLLNNLVHDNGVDGIEIHGRYFTIANNNIYNNINTSWANNHPDGIQFLGAGADGFNTVQFAKVYNNIFRNQTQNIFLEGVGSSESSDCSDVWIYNNIFYNTNGTVNGVNMGSLGSVHMMIKWSKNVYIYNNTLGFSNNRLIHIQGCKNGTVFVKNNIIDGQSAGAYGLYVEDPSDMASGSADNNLYYGNSTDVIWGSSWYNAVASFKSANPTYETHGIGANPGFSAAFPDITFPSTSPAVNTGSDLSAYFTTDYYNKARSGTWDIGAYEYQSGGTVDTAPAAPTGLVVS